VTISTQGRKVALGGLTAKERDAIREIDSAFGILLTITIFQSNLVMRVFQDSGLLGGRYTASILALCVIFAILVGMLGLIRQSWRCKILGWALAWFLFLWEFAVVLLDMLWVRARIVVSSQQTGLIMALAMLGSSALTKILVCGEYRRRMNQASSCGIHTQTITRCENATTYSFIVFSAITVVVALFYPP
jgi:hypothetical protein